MATFTLTITTSKTGAELAALLAGQKWNGGLVFIQIKSASAAAAAGPGAKVGGGGGGYAEWGTLAGFATDGVNISDIANGSVNFGTAPFDDPIGTGLVADGLATAYAVTDGKSDGTAGDDGTTLSSIAPTLAFAGGAGGAVGGADSGGGGGAATAAGAGQAGTAGSGGGVGGTGGLDGDGNAGGGDGGAAGAQGANATNGGGGGHSGTGTAGYVKITGLVSTGKVGRFVVQHALPSGV